MGGHFPVIDLGNSNSVVSIKSMNIFGKSCYAKDVNGNVILGKDGKATYDSKKMSDRAIKYYETLDNIHIKVNENDVEKILHLEVNKGPAAQNHYVPEIKKNVEKHIEDKKENFKGNAEVCAGKGTTKFSIG